MFTMIPAVYDLLTYLPGKGLLTNITCPILSAKGESEIKLIHTQYFSNDYLMSQHLSIEFRITQAYQPSNLFTAC